MSRPPPLVSEESAVYLARIINRVAASFDVTALSSEAYTLLDRIMDALWREHQNVLSMSESSAAVLRRLT